MDFPDEAFDRRKELTSGEYELYQVLCKYRCRDKHSENFGLAFPSRDTLATDLSKVKEYVSQITSSLMRKGWVEKSGWKIRLVVGFQQQEKLDNPNFSNSEKVRTILPFEKLESKNLKSNSKNSEGQKLENDTAHIKEVEPLEPIRTMKREGTHMQENQTGCFERETEGDCLNHPSVLYWWAAVERKRTDENYAFRSRLPKSLNIPIAERIASGVKDPIEWRRAVDFWDGNGSMMQNVMSILEKHEEYIQKKLKETHGKTGTVNGNGSAKRQQYGLPKREKQTQMSDM